MLWESAGEKFKDFGGELLTETKVTCCHYCNETKSWQVSFQRHDGSTLTKTCKNVISSAPIKSLVTKLISPTPNETCYKAADKLQYRDFIIVVLIVETDKKLDDNWIYIHDDQVDVARIQNFKSWSEAMVPNDKYASFGLEYFCNDNEEFWHLSDEDLISKAKSEFAKLNIISVKAILDGCVVRQKKAYPVYTGDYKEQLKTIENTLRTEYPNLHLVGRNGLHKYNNQDHSMMTSIFAVQNILRKNQTLNQWHLNQDDDYHELKSKSSFDITIGLRKTPETID